MTINEEGCEMIHIKENAFKDPYEVHVWRASISKGSANPDAYLKFLTADEIKKAHEFYSEKNRRIFILARGFLRKTLAEYCDVQPDQIEFTFGPFKKPYIETTPKRLEFNLSHSDDEMILAIALDRKVGVDVEAIDTACSWEDVCKNVFSEEEVSELMLLPEELRSEAFFKGWTQKEAFIKALGLGASAPLKDYSFQLDPRSPHAMVGARHSNVLSQWHMIGIKGIASHACSLAVEQKEKINLKLFGDTEAVYPEQ